MRDQNGRTLPGAGQLGGVTFGIGGDYTSAEDAAAAYENAYNNPINGTWNTTGAGMFAGSHGEIDKDGNWLWADGWKVGGGSPVGWGMPYVLPGYTLGKVDIAAQEQRPENPGIREVAFSTYGINIPVSIGKRAVTGNIIDATPPTPEIVGAYEYWVEYKIPIFESGLGPS
jgi:hypothetical protein